MDDPQRGLGETPNVVSLEARCVVFMLEDSFAQQDEGPGGGDLVQRPPFLPNAFEGLPSTFSKGAFEEAMLGGLRDPGVANLAGRGDSHTLEPSSDGQTTVEG
jgi:hypothetical protein